MRRTPQLQQVIGNLLSNALKFTPSGGRVDVSALLRGSFIELHVRDTGSGITPDFLPYVFDRFRQADSTTTRVYGGLGIGLAIARHLVELHGGRIHASSEGENKGATFIVELPALTEAQVGPRGGEGDSPLPGSTARRPDSRYRMPGPGLSLRARKVSERPPASRSALSVARALHGERQFRPRMIAAPLRSPPAPFAAGPSTADPRACSRPCVAPTVRPGPAHGAVFRRVR